MYFYHVHQFNVYTSGISVIPLHSYNNLISQPMRKPITIYIAELNSTGQVHEYTTYIITEIQTCSTVLLVQSTGITS